MRKRDGDSIEYKCMSFSLQTEIKRSNVDVHVWSEGSNNTVGVETETVTIVCTRYNFNDFLKGCAFMEKNWSVPFKPFIRQTSMPLLH